MTFQRENRYIVVKLKDLDQDQEKALRVVMYGYHIPTRECLVIESDWPEYEPAWRMIQARVEGATLSPAHIEDGEEVEVVGHLALDEPFNGTEGLEIGEWEFVPDLSAVESMLAVSTGDMVPLMTVDQHERIAAALSGTTSDRYRAELYDEVWQKARDMGYMNVTMALAELEKLKAAPPAAGVPDGWKLVPMEPTKKMLDATSWPGCAAQDYRHMLAAAPTPPASEQQRAVVMPEGVREAMAKAASAWLHENDPQGLDWCDARNVDDLLDALFEAAPHLAKGEGCEMAEKIKPCHCGYEGELMGMVHAGFLSLTCPNCNRTAEAFTPETLAKEWNKPAPTPAPGERPMSFNPLISLARNAKRQKMEIQCDPQLVLNLAAERDQLRAELEAIRGRQPDAVSVPRELLERISLSRPFEQTRYQAVDELRALLSTKNAEDGQPCDK